MEYKQVIEMFNTNQNIGCINRAMLVSTLRNLFDKKDVTSIKELTTAYTGWSKAHGSVRVYEELEGNALVHLDRLCARVDYLIPGNYDTREAGISLGTRRVGKCRKLYREFVGYIPIE